MPISGVIGTTVVGIASVHMNTKGQTYGDAIPTFFKSAFEAQITQITGIVSLSGGQKMQILV